MGFIGARRSNTDKIEFETTRAAEVTDWGLGIDPAGTYGHPNGGKYTFLFWLIGDISGSMWRGLRSGGKPRWRALLGSGSNVPSETFFRFWQKQVDGTDTSLAKLY
ncbi:hypothetical protein QAD02_002612 [Eretmocerus hayati]|uniref:Uncharacterized protein n=1 Tax=Eretmocerus hayati TaxID=131215 RepID=A0ACC2NKD7_9HYME|nr:hypothetical protein QAD02_002612 [Eretmocerus hayati]